MNTRILMWLAALLALVGLAVNVAVDLDNVYDMTMAVIWVLTLLVAVAAAVMKPGAAPASSPAPAQQQ
jgi:hypothetical protein